MKVRVKFTSLAQINNRFTPIELQKISDIYDHDTLYEEYYEDKFTRDIDFWSVSVTELSCTFLKRCNFDR